MPVPHDVDFVVSPIMCGGTPNIIAISPRWNARVARNCDSSGVIVICLYDRPPDRTAGCRRPPCDATHAAIVRAAASSDRFAPFNVSNTDDGFALSPNHVAPYWPAAMLNPIPERACSIGDRAFKYPGSQKRPIWIMSD